MNKVGATHTHTRTRHTVASLLLMKMDSLRRVTVDWRRRRRRRTTYHCAKSSLFFSLIVTRKRKTNKAEISSLS